MKKIILMVLIGATIFSLSACGQKKYIKVHVPMIPIQICEFEGFTDAEKSTMSEAVGSKIRRNQKRCYIDRDAYNQLIEEHNKCHGEEGC